MPQERRVVRRVQEYPGTVCWEDYAVRCPDCGQWTEDYGDVQTQVDGEWHYLCSQCVAKCEEHLS